MLKTMMKNRAKSWRAFWLAAVVVACALSIEVDVFAVGTPRTEQAAAQHLTPLQLEIEKQRQRLSSADVEERREALTRLGSMHKEGASRAALSGLADSAPIVRATAAAAILSLPAEASAVSLTPLLSDKDEFVRQQVAYALGQTRSRAGVAALIGALSDKKESVRGAAAVALGQIGDAAAVISLAVILDPQSTLGKKSKKAQREKNPFIVRAAARSLGQIGNRAGVPALIFALQDEKAEDDVRREAAFALGEIGDATALPALRRVEAAWDPYLSTAAQEAIRKISSTRMIGI